MIYKLCRRILGSSTTVEISSQQFREIERARDCLIECLYIEEKFNLIVDNYLEFEVDLLEGAARNMVGSLSKYSEFQIDRSRINRRLINLLSTCKTYLDQSKVHLATMFGRRSENYCAFKEELEAEAGLSYRVMSEVRNFAQHRGYPIHSVSYPAKWTGIDDNAKLPFSMVPFIDIKELQADPQFESDVIKQLKRKDERVDVRPLVRGYLASLGTIHERMRNRLKPHIADWETTIVGAIELYKSQCLKESSIVGLSALAKDAGKIIEEIPLITGFIDYRKEIEARVLTLSTLPRRYVTSEGDIFL